MNEGRTHDRLFRAAMTDPQLANALLREHLPADVLELLRPGPPKLMAGGGVDRRLRETQSDALFQFHLRGGQRLRVYCLVEHKSAPDRWVALQVLRYMLATWERQRAHGAKRLTPIVPLVLYHGASRWTASRRFTGLMRRSPSLIRHTLDFEYVLVDASRDQADPLAQNALLKALLQALQYGTRPPAEAATLEHVVGRVWRELDAGPDFLRDAFIAYVGGAAYGTLGTERLMRAMNVAVPHRKEETLTRAAREWREEGLEQGLEQGKVLGQRKALLNVLVLRFKRVPLEFRRAVAGSDEAHLERWLARALTAPSVVAVFKGR